MRLRPEEPNEKKKRARLRLMRKSFVSEKNKWKEITINIIRPVNYHTSLSCEKNNMTSFMENTAHDF